MIWHSEILPAAQVEVLRAVGPLARANGYYLAGGTAVALHYGHRRSIDLDWFGQNPRATATDLDELLKAAGINAEATQTSEGTWLGSAGGVKLSFFRYWYPSLLHPTVWQEFGIEIATLDDLGAMKLLAIAQRGAKKDFIDVHELLSQGFTLPQLLDCYRKKFARDETISVLRGLVYFDDAEGDPMPDMLGPARWDNVKADCERWVREVTR